MINVCVIIVGLLLPFYYSPAVGQFYWRNYNGEIPEDAIPGGLINNTITYIGLIPVGKAYISAMIFPNDLNGYGALPHRVSVSSQRVKIMCSLLNKRFKWVVEIPPSCRLVTSQHFVRSPIRYIGRGMYEGQLHTGRTARNYPTLYFPWLAPIMRTATISNFERLVFCR